MYEPVHRPFHRIPGQLIFLLQRSNSTSIRPILKSDPSKVNLISFFYVSKLYILFWRTRYFNQSISIPISLQILVGTYYALSTVMCMNLYIALLTETFNQVYQNAKANASLLQATTILQIEKVLSKKRRHKAMETMQEECGPLVSRIQL